MTRPPARTMYRLAITAGGVLLLSTAALAQTGPPIAGHTGTIALEGTVEQEHAAADLLAVKAVDGTKHVLHLAKSLVAHGGAKERAGRVKASGQL
jgi:hypothetical protein